MLPSRGSKKALGWRSWLQNMGLHATVEELQKEGLHARISWLTVGGQDGSGDSLAALVGVGRLGRDVMGPASSRPTPVWRGKGRVEGKSEE